ncbi:helix-turn-helix domain-containing protein [Haloimpatiens sp. FM7315]
MVCLLKIKEIRESKEMTQTELAKKSGLSQSYLSELEHNKKVLHLDNFVK